MTLIPLWIRPILIGPGSAIPTTFLMEKNPGWIHNGFIARQNRIAKRMDALYHHGLVS